MSEELTVVGIKTYTVTETSYSNGKTSLGRLNEGFNPLELLGVLSLTHAEIVQLINGNPVYRPDVITREVIIAKEKVPYE